MSVNLLENLAVGKAWNPKAACVFVLALVFLCGGVAGAVAMDAVFHSRPRISAFDTTQGKAAYFEKVQKDLDLTPEQARQMESILNDFWQYYRTVLADGKQRIEQVLTPAQKKRFEQLLQEQKK
jgi:Spy/CpxP family protein refolding chaperone